MVKLNSLKISILVPDLSGAGVIRGYLLAQALKLLNCQVKIFGFLFGKELYALPAFDVEIVSAIGTNYPEFISRAQHLLEQVEGEIIYAIKPKPTSFGLSLLKKLPTRCRVILDIDDWELSWHGGDLWGYHPTPKQFARDIFKKDGGLRHPDHPLYLKWMESLICRADAITTHTQFLKQRFGGVYLPNGKDTSLFDPHQYDPETSRIRYSLAEYRVLMFPGAPRPHKGLEDLLTALDLLNDPEIRLAIVGGNPYDNYEDQLMEKWGRWIVKMPKYPIKIMPEVVAAAHAVVVPQRDTLTAVAQFPLKLTDGMAMAKPVLSTRVGDIPEILGETGFLVDPSSPEQLAQQIQWIFQNQMAASDRGLKARERCVEKYSLQAMASILSEVITGL